MLKYKADRKTLFWMLMITVTFGVLWFFNGLHWSLYVFYLYLSVTASVIAHNHNHLPMWKNETLNDLTDYWVTIFYGFPAFAWIPTHNRNHHKFNNKEPDYTKTYRYSEGNNIMMLLSYPTISGYFQQPAIKEYLKDIRKRNPKKFKQHMIQIAVLVTWIAFWMILDWKKALIYVVIPQQVSLFAVLIFNFVQHVHADEESEWNHSRNIVGNLNFFMFNNGLHTVHHMNAAMHWSLAPEAHAKIEHLIDPSLNEKSFWWFLARNYIVGIFVPSVRTKSMRLERLKKLQEVQTA